jgi:hypothetical protein
MAHLSRFKDIKDSLGESGNTNNAKIRLYQELADGYLYAKLTNVKGVTIPLAAPPEHLRDLMTTLSIAYFYKFESGDKDLAETAEKNVDTWFNSTYMRPAFKAKAGTTI